MKLLKRIFRLIMNTLKWFLLIILLLLIFSGLTNLTLPTKSKSTGTLSKDEKAYIAEAMNLLEKNGSQTWQGWGDVKVPIIVYNEENAFLIGFSNPPAGWQKMPSGEYRGAEWQLVEGDDFHGKPYFKQMLPDPQITPENFTVKVGNTWVATMQTKEYSAVEFYRGFRNELPPVLKQVFPYRLFWQTLMGRAENYISSLAHEAFHAFQGTLVPERLEAGENAARLSNSYPWENSINESGWITETNYLMDACKTADMGEKIELISNFLESRQQRRLNANLSLEHINYEKNREWLEGLAKYAELALCNNARGNKDYKPLNEIRSIRSFKNYRKQEQHFGRQIDEVARSVKRSGESRFYYVGMLQGVVLDQIMPDWKSLAFEGDTYLEDMLLKATNQEYNAIQKNSTNGHGPKVSAKSIPTKSGFPISLMPL